MRPENCLKFYLLWEGLFVRPFSLDKRVLPTGDSDIVSYSLISPLKYISFVASATI